MTDQQLTKAIRDLQDHVREAKLNLGIILNGSSADLVHQSRRLIEESLGVMEEAEKVLARKGYEDCPAALKFFGSK